MSRLWKGPELYYLTACAHAVHSLGGSPMTGVGGLYQNCGSVHEVDSVREDLILDLRTAVGYELPWQRGMLDPRARFLHWRMTGSGPGCAGTAGRTPPALMPSGSAGARPCRPAGRRSPPRPWRWRVRP